MAKDILVRGVESDLVDYLEKRRRNVRWSWNKASWSELIRVILREWVEKEKALEARANNDQDH